MAQAERDVFEHADLHQAIAEVLASGGPVEDEMDAATEVMDLLVQRRIIPPPMGYVPEATSVPPPPECGHFFHATTARGFCPDCGGPWKRRHLPRAGKGGS